MHFHRSLEALAIPDAWLTIGSFDGVHLGHQAIIRSMVEGAHAAGVLAIVLTFDPHPVQVLRPEIPLELLTSIEERAVIFEGLGVDLVIAHPFNHETAKLSAEAFLEQIKRSIGFTRLFVGYDFAMGRNREGDTARLAQLGVRLGYQLQIFDPVSEGGAVFSSSRIRRLVAEGDVRSAAEMLGRPFTLTGTVVAGAQRGRSIGIPTANIAVPRGRAVPRTGVYACRVTVLGQTYAAATNIGVRPTFEPDTVDETVEAHILDFEKDIYNEIIQVSFVERLRGEQKFSGVDALIAQIHTDIGRTREVLNETVS